MGLNAYFKSVLEMDNAAVVICDINHKIIYMNPAAIKTYSKWGGEKILGQSLFECHNERSCEIIKNVVDWFLKSKDNNKVHIFYNEKQAKDEYMIALRDDNGELIGYYEKHEYRTKDETPFYEMP